MRVIGVIPARYGSSRLPGKPLIDILGRPMVWWVYQQAVKFSGFEEVVIAADDERILNICNMYGMNAVMTSTEHDTPTSRLYEVSTKIPADLYMQIMGDEPLVDAECFPLLIPERIESEYYVAALTNIITGAPDVIDFSNQKVVTNSRREALFISRSPIPYPKGSLNFQYEKVTGVQIFSGRALEFFNATPKSQIETAEENDLMRFIEHGIKVKMIISGYKTISVDTHKDIDLVRELLKEKNNHASV